MTRMLTDLELPPETPRHVVEMVEESKRIRDHRESYIPALRDRSIGVPRARTCSPRTKSYAVPVHASHVAAAAACFELAQHLHRAGHPDDSVRWFREAHRLQPDNWTYRRQAWFFADPVLIEPRRAPRTSGPTTATG